MKYCCPAFEASTAEGTDSQGFNSLFWFGHGPGLFSFERDRWNVGTGLPNPIFCPWCATRLTPPKVGT